MLYDEELQGHDSQLDEVTIDVVRRTVSLRLLSYPTQEAAKRISIEIAFTEVESVNTIADLKELELNRSAGNVNYLQVEKGQGTSYFYLAGGCLMITARAAPTLILR